MTSVPDGALGDVPDGRWFRAQRGEHAAAGGTIAVVAIVLVAVGLRPGIVAVGPILPSIVRQFGLSHAAASLLTSIPDLLMGLLALPTPWLARRYGRDPILLAALLVLFASIASRALAAGPASLYLATAGVGVGIAISGALIGGFIKARFPHRAALMTGVYATALSLGSTVSAALTGPVAATAASGWRLASGMWCPLVLLGLAGWTVVAVGERRHASATSVSAVRARLPLRDGRARLVALFFACDNLLFYALLTWTSPLYREAGRSAATAGLVLASFTAAFMIANPIFGLLSRSTDRRGWLALSAVLALAGLIPTALAPDVAPFVFVPLCAFGLGGGFTLGMTLPLDNVDSVEEANVWNAFVLTVGYLVAAAGPLVVGRLRDVNGDFHAAVGVLTAVACVMFALTPFLEPRPNR